MSCGWSLLLQGDAMEVNRGHFASPTMSKGAKDLKMRKSSLKHLITSHTIHYLLFTIHYYLRSLIHFSEVSNIGVPQIAQMNTEIIIAKLCEISRILSLKVAQNKIHQRPKDLPPLHSPPNFTDFMNFKNFTNFTNFMNFTNSMNFTNFTNFMNSMNFTNFTNSIKLRNFHFVDVMLDGKNDQAGRVFSTSFDE